MRAMILAAGRGERMRPLTDRIPKPLLPVGGQPLIVWHLQRLAAAGVREVVINHAHLGEQIETALGDGAAWGLRIRYSPEPAGALETAGGIVQALPLLGDAPFFVLSGDVYVDCDYRVLMNAASLADGATAFLWLVDNPPWHAGGDFALRDGRLFLDEDARNDRRDKLTYANLGVFSPAFFAGLPPGARLPLGPLFKQAIAAGRVRGARYTGLWDNLGTPQQLHALDTLLRTR
jgi:MurNAc alpha-1-phosphate uridylyltransferase